MLYQSSKSTAQRPPQISLLVLALTWLAIGLVPREGLASPLDLTDRTPRWIQVRFEVSPADEPGLLDRVWSPTRRAYLEPDVDADRLTIRIPAEEVEAQFRSTGSDPVEGSFSDFVWRIDSVSGHVLAAGLTGQVREHLRLGPFRTSTQIEIHVEMTTTAHAVGFEPGYGILGIRTNRFCAPNREAHDCVPVEPIRFDASRGYVNAVGSLRAATPVAKIMAFSPLGEVEFREASGNSGENGVFGASSADSVCSVTFSGRCEPDLGGEL